MPEIIDQFFRPGLPAVLAIAGFFCLMLLWQFYEGLRDWQKQYDEGMKLDRVATNLKARDDYKRRQMRRKIG